MVYDLQLYCYIGPFSHLLLEQIQALPLASGLEHQAEVRMDLAGEEGETKQGQAMVVPMALAKVKRKMVQQLIVAEQTFQCS